MIRAYERIPKGAKIILTVHDEIVTLTPDSLVDKTQEAIRDAMEGINFLKVPLVADVKIVQKWGDAK
jgi:DNA polymerase I-like protein with 3'-5' exonuclease and polymerase domains